MIEKNEDLVLEFERIVNQHHYILSTFISSGEQNKDVMDWYKEVEEEKNKLKKQILNKMKK